MSFTRPWAGAFAFRSFVREEPDAFDPAAVEAIRAAILGSPYLADSQLNAPFAGTSGFSVTFRREALPQVRAAFPAFGPYLDRVLLDGCDGFVLNPLLIGDGKGVGPHVDLSLVPYDPTVGCPAAVSVLYVQVPEGLAGGELHLAQFGRPVGRVVPRARTLVTFRGDLTHHVAPVEGGAPGLGAARISLVTEQYVLSAAEAARIPRFAIASRAELEARV